MTALEHKRDRRPRDGPMRPRIVTEHDRGQYHNLNRGPLTSVTSYSLLTLTLSHDGHLTHPAVLLTDDRRSKVAEISA